MKTGKTNNSSFELFVDRKDTMYENPALSAVNACEHEAPHHRPIRQILTFDQYSRPCACWTLRHTRGVGARPPAPRDSHIVRVDGACGARAHVPTPRLHAQARTWEDAGLEDEKLLTSGGTIACRPDSLHTGGSLLFLCPR